MEWINIPGWNNRYSVNKHGVVRNNETGHIIIGDKNSIGYPRVTLYYDGKSKHYFRHRLVAELFIPNPNNLPEVDHIDHDILNYDYTNLRWITRIDNEAHSYINGNKQFKFQPFKVTWINDIESIHRSAAAFAHELKVVPRTVRLWLKGNNRGYLNYGIRKIEYITPNDYRKHIDDVNVIVSK